MHSQLKRYEDAERELQETARTVLGTHNTDRKTAETLIGAFIALYEDWGRVNKASEWRAKLPS